MEFFPNAHFRFMKLRTMFVPISALLVLIGLFLVFVKPGLNMGIDFAGGSQLNLAFRDEPNLDELRRQFTESGFGDAQLQRFGDAGDKEVLVKLPVVEGQSEAEAASVAVEEGRMAELVGLLDKTYDAGAGFDLNRAGADSIANRLAESDPDAKAAEGLAALNAHYAEVADALIGQRKVLGMFRDPSELGSIPGVSDAVAAELRNNSTLGGYALLGSGNVGPTVGRELRKTGALAVVFSLLGMMAYIWIRFEFRFGLGAVAAIFHDVIVVLGAYALSGYEFNLISIAAFLTLVGYSTNDTVVIFDRVRENMRKARRLPLEEIMDQSINQTLSRTILTSGTTLVVVAAILIFGGDVLRGFGFVLTLGIIVGTYSSVYIASPVALLWENFSAERRKAKDGKARVVAAKG